MSRIIVLATLALIHCWSSTQLVLATENARRAPTGMPPATWGSHEIRSSSLPMGRWLDSDQCFDSFGQNSAVAMDPWATGTSDQHPTFRVEAVARAAGNSSRDSRHFDLWVDGKIIASSESTGSGVGCTEEAGSHAMGHAMGHRFHAAAAHELYSDCLTATPRVARLTADLPASAKYWALIPAESQCTHTKFRWSASFKNQCGGGTWRMPRDPVTGELIRASTPGAVAACAAIGGKLADVDWKNLIKVSEVAATTMVSVRRKST
ncbi:hypothetical protein BC828DRAFT_396930 [Blastocladiella britannica]|nr:hypothetical protein BC828DRAFT_396930 [Blastocladiella britannica]